MAASIPPNSPQLISTLLSWLVGCAHPLLVPHKLNKVDSEKASTSRSIVKVIRIFQQIPWDHSRCISLLQYLLMQPCMMKYVIWLLGGQLSDYHSFSPQIREKGMIKSFQRGIKMMNDRILEMAPCSLAIVVDQAPFATFSPNMEACNHLFMGGSDDREALAIGARMVGQLNINRTIVRILSNANTPFEDSTETKFENDVMNEIRSQMARKQRVQYVEEIVVNGTGTVAVIRSIEDHYDLIIVGRYHPKSPLMLGLSDWEGGTQVGAVGNMFASADSNSNSTIVLVQQHNGLFAVDSTRT